MRLFNFLKKRDDKQENQNGIEISQKSVSKDTVNSFNVHPDIEELIWIENGPNKNYYPEEMNGNRHQTRNFGLTITFIGEEEPSLIDMNLEVRIPQNNEEVPRLSYYPFYKYLNSQQKYLYWNYLSNPYQSLDDIGYLFILYYGLERHIKHGRYEKSINVIMKLREIHSNSSFQYYSGNAIVLACMLHQRADLMQKFMKTVNDENKKDFSDKLYLLCKYSLLDPLTSSEIMKMSREFGFRKKSYIKGYPGLFTDTLAKIIREKFGTDGVLLSDIITNLEILPKETMRLFANTSLNDETFTFPDLITVIELQEIMFELLNETHEKVKKILAEMRKNKIVINKKESPKKTTKPKKKLEFDYPMEAQLLDDLNSKSNPIDKHFAYIYLQDFYYKYRDLNPMYLEECIIYCYKDIEILEQVNDKYVEEEIISIRNLKDYYSKEEYDTQVQKVKEKRFNGRIPAFSRLAIIYEKRKDYNAAINISNMAISYYKNRKMNTSEFEKRLVRLKEKENS